MLGMQRIKCSINYLLSLCVVHLICYYACWISLYCFIITLLFDAIPTHSFVPPLRLFLTQPIAYTSPSHIFSSFTIFPSYTFVKWVDHTSLVIFLHHCHVLNRRVDTILATYYYDIKCVTRHPISRSTLQKGIYLYY